MKSLPTSTTAQLDAWHRAKSKGNAHITTMGTEGCRVDFFFFGHLWRAQAHKQVESGKWSLRCINPPLKPLTINEWSPVGLRQLSFPSSGPSHVLQLAKESIFLLRYVDTTPIFHECDSDYRWLVKRMENPAIKFAAVSITDASHHPAAA